MRRFAFRETKFAAQNFAAEIIGAIGGQADIAHHNSDACAGHLVRFRATPCPVANIQHEMEKRIKFADHSGVKIKTSEVRVERVEVIAARGVDRIRVCDARVGAAVRGKHPAIGGNFA